MKNYYSINYLSLVISLTPVLLRRDIIASFLESFAKPLNALNDIFNTHVRNLSTNTNAQICYMQAMLNDRFGSAGGKITVRTAYIDFDSYLLWIEGQNKPLLVYKEETVGFAPYLLNRDDRISTNNIDFERVLPSGFVPDDTELRQLDTLVNKNKLASKKYRVVYE